MTIGFVRNPTRRMVGQPNSRWLSTLPMPCRSPPTLLEMAIYRQLRDFLPVFAARMTSHLQRAQE